MIRAAAARYASIEGGSLADAGAMTCCAALPGSATASASASARAAAVKQLTEVTEKSMGAIIAAECGADNKVPCIGSGVLTTIRIESNSKE